MHRLASYIIVSSALVLAVPNAVRATDYDVDASHSSVTFKIRHLIGKVHGKFDKLKGTFSFEPNKPETWKAEATIDAASINTNEPKRDKHLRSPDFFDTAKFKELKFVADKAGDVSGNKSKLHGNLTIHGVTKPVVLDIEFNGTGTDPWGNKRVAFTGTTQVNRKDFGLNWNKALETGGLLVGEDVEITIEVEGLPKQAEKLTKK